VEAPAASADRGPSTEPLPGTDRASRPSEQKSAAIKKPGGVERADTIALVEKASAPRELPKRLGIALIVGLSLLAGIVTYFVRASSSSDALPRDAPTATADRDRAGSASGEGW
jgi:serine/threonine-protein kinase